MTYTKIITTMKKATKDEFMYALAALVVICTVLWFGALLFVGIPEGNSEIITTAAGIFLGSGWVTVMGYFFGSSKGSSDKNEMLNKTNTE